MSTPFDPAPSDLDALLDPEWLTEALDDVLEGERVVRVDRVDGSETLASKVRFRTVVENADGARREGSYCVKGHFNGSPETLGSETRFYRHLATTLPIRTPRPHYAGIDQASHRTLVIMDDIVAGGGRFLDAHAAFSVDLVREALGELARLHAATWNDQRLAREPWLSPRIADIATMFSEEHLQSLLDDGRGADVAADLRDAASLIAAMLRQSELAGFSVIHADPHSGNLYLDASERPCFFDWQIVQWGHWSTDVSYHLGTVLPPQARRSHERDLLAHYLAELDRAGGAAPPWDEAWEHYACGFVWGYFLWTITMVRSRDEVLVHFPRLAAALSDHETFERLGA